MSYVFFSFVSLNGGGAAEHAEYNRWHLYDHRPENLALEGVRWGDRWYRPEEYRAVSQAAAPHDDTDYIAMYWFAEPFRKSQAEWNQLALDSFQWGRGPLIPGVTRTLLGFFQSVNGYAAPSALVSPDVLPFRPNRGVHVTLQRFAVPYSPATHEHHTWEDRVLAPAELEVPGVAGVWTFSFAEYQALGELTFNPDGQDSPGSMRLHLVYLDDDPVETTGRLRELRRELAEEGKGEPECGAALLISTPVRTIVPFQDW